MGVSQDEEGNAKEKQRGSTLASSWPVHKVCRMLFSCSYRMLFVQLFISCHIIDLYVTSYINM